MNSIFKKPHPKRPSRINWPAASDDWYRYQGQLFFRLLPLWICMMFHSGQTLAQNTKQVGPQTSMNENKAASRRLLGYEITNMGYGGPALKFSRFNNQFAIMTGGRGSCIINNRFTLGGGGYGIASSIKITGLQPDTIRHFKMGYGGLETGYIFYSGKRVNIGSSLLLAVGGAFWQGKPKGKSEPMPGNDFRIIPVLEPSIYGEIALNRFMWLHAGISYRYINHSGTAFNMDKNMTGFSCYLGLLFGKTN